MRMAVRYLGSLSIAMAMLIAPAGSSLAQEPTASPSPTPAATPWGIPPGVPHNPPTVVGICSTEIEHLWRISTGELDLMYYKVSYTPSWADMTVWRGTADLERRDGEYAVTVTSSRSDGEILEVIWTYFSGMRNSATASEEMCQPEEAASPSPPPSEPALQPALTSATSPEDALVILVRIATAVVDMVRDVGE
jgi:hypothetical protein